jgi:CRISPR type IV-associated DEAD/DEAH-box helicase Csf4
MQKLNIDGAWGRPVSSVQPGWLYSPTTLFLPDGTAAAKFRPPTAADFRKEEVPEGVQLERWRAWYEVMSGYIAGTWGSAAGGCVVLLSSYDKINALEARLRKQVPEEVLVVARKGVRTTVQVQEFVRLTKAGKKPLMLGVGAMWTGVDLHGGNHALFEETVPAAKDNVFTDLIIPMLPFGMNNTPTHLMRTQHNMIWEFNEAALLTKQGIGRLVRREGLPRNRRLHLLDGRLLDPVFQSVTATMARILSPYERRETVQ